MNTKLLAVPAAALALSLAACGGDDEPMGGTGGGGNAGGGGKAVEIADFKYAPPEIRVKAGTEVRFTNSDSAPHTATSTEKGLFETGDLGKDESGSIKVDRPGTYEYFCRFHVFMKGKVIAE